MHSTSATLAATTTGAAAPHHPHPHPHPPFSQRRHVDRRVPLGPRAISSSVVVGAGLMFGPRCINDRKWSCLSVRPPRSNEAPAHTAHHHRRRRRHRHHPGPALLGPAECRDALCCAVLCCTTRQNNYAFNLGLLVLTCGGTAVLFCQVTRAIGTVGFPR